jgi:hypothetical protein
VGAIANTRYEVGDEAVQKVILIGKVARTQISSLLASPRYRSYRWFRWML